MEKTIGKINAARGLIVEVSVFSDNKPGAKELLTIKDRPDVILELYSYTDEDSALCIVLEGEGIRKGDEVVSLDRTITVPVGPAVMGRMFNALGEPIDGGVSLEGGPRKGIYDIPPPNQNLTEVKENDILETGIKVVDFFTPFVKGTKIGIAGGAGVGKTVLITAIIHSVASKKIALPMFVGIGERIHEGQELQEALAEAGLLKDAVLFMGQMNENASMRTIVGQSAAALAQHFRDEEKKDTLFFVDNIYRFVQAGNELSSMMGQIPSEGAYQPTIFSDLRRLQERLYSVGSGSITSVQTIYIPADDITDPAVQEIQQQLDSVIVLSRKKAEANIYPAVDLLETHSSMISPKIIGETHYRLVTKVQSIIQEYESLRTIVSIIGEHELSQKDQLTYRKAITLIQYFTQDLYSAGKLSGEGVKYFKKDELIKGVENIIKAETM